MLARSMVSPISPKYFQVVHISILGIGVLLGGFGFAFLVSEVVWGFISPHVWSRWTLLALILISSLLPVPMSQQQPFAVLFAIQATTGLCLGGIGVLSRLLVPRLAEPPDEAKYFGYLGLVFAIGSMAGSLLGGAVYGAVGLSESFVLAGLASLFPVLPLWFLRFDSGADLKANPTPAVENGIRLPRLLLLSELIALGFVGLTTSLLSIFYNLLLPNIITRDPSFSATVLDISLVIASFSFSSGVFQPVMGMGGSRNPRRWITAALIGGGLTFAPLVYSSNMSEVYLISFLAGIASAAITPLALSVMSAGVQPSRLGRVFGLYGAAEDSGIILGALAGGFIWADLGAKSVFLVMALLFIAIGMIYGIVSSKAASRPRKQNSLPSVQVVVHELHVHGTRRVGLCSAFRDRR